MFHVGRRYGGIRDEQRDEWNLEVTRSSSAAADLFQADHLFSAWYFFRNLVHIHKYLKRQAQARNGCRMAIGPRDQRRPCRLDFMLMYTYHAYVLIQLLLASKTTLAVQRRPPCA